MGCCICWTVHVLIWITVTIGAASLCFVIDFWPLLLLFALGFIAMLIFVLVMELSVFYAARKGILTWK